MNCRVCNQPLFHLLTYENMPAMAQHLSTTPEEHTVTLDLCQCRGCGLVQLSNEPVHYWNQDIRVDNPAMSERIRSISEGMDFVSCNCLEHRPYPNEYLLSFSGTGLIEVPNFDMILQKSLFAEIMLDHLLYFTADTLRFTLVYNGFDVIEIKSEWQDYILSATVRKREELCLAPFREQQERLKANLDAYIAKYERVAIYGASHQAFAYIAMLQPKIIFVVDDSSLKVGNYTPVGSLAIYTPEALKRYSADAVVIMAGGYSEEIAQNLNFDGGVGIMRDWGVEVIK